MGNPHVDSIECDVVRVTAHRKGTQYAPVAGAQLFDGIAAVKRRPDVRTVEGNVVHMRAEAKGVYCDPVAGPQFRYAVSEEIGDPDIGPIEREAAWTVSNREGSQDGAVTRAH